MTRTDPIHEPQTIESLINQMQSLNGHCVYEIHTGSNPVPGSNEPCATVPGGEYYPLTEAPSGYEARCTCGETFSSFGQAERHEEKH